MKKQLLIFLLSIVTLSAFGQAGSQSISVLRSRVLDSASVNGAHGSGYGDLYFNAQRAQPAWLFWDAQTGTYKKLGSFAGGWKTAGTTTLTGSTSINGGGNILDFSNLVGFSVTADDIALLGTTNGAIDIGTTSNGVIISGNAVKMGIAADVAYFQATGDDIQIASSDDVTITAGTGTSGHNINIGLTNGDLKINGDPGTAGYVLQSNGAAAAPTWVAPGGGSYTALTDGAAITVTGQNHTLTSTQAAITWTLSQTGNYSEVWIVLNATASTYTFPVNTLTVSEGVASGDNTATLGGVSGDNYVMGISKNGSNYRISIKNYGQ